MQRSILNVHTPSTSFAIIHSLSQEDLETLHDKLTRKVYSSYHGRRVGPGWLKYEFNGTIWNLDDDSDYTIFTWRQQQNIHDKYLHAGSSSSVPASPARVSSPSPGLTSSSSTDDTSRTVHSPTIHLHDPSLPLPGPSGYHNPVYYVFKMQNLRPGSPRRPKSLTKSKRSQGSANSNGREFDGTGSQLDDDIPAFKREFEKFHSENGVRTVTGSIGPVNNVRMLLKSGYRHVYMSRKFALKHKFVPADAAPGYHGYSGLVNLGTFPITLTPASSPASSSISPSHPLSRPASLHPSSSMNGTNGKLAKPTTVKVPVYLAEEPHFDVVLGRSFFDRRQIRMNAVDPTDVVCLDTGEKIECELVILKDGRGEIVTVT